MQHKKETWESVISLFQKAPCHRPWPSRALDYVPNLRNKLSPLTSDRTDEVLKVCCSIGSLTAVRYALDTQLCY